MPRLAIVLLVCAAATCSPTALVAEDARRTAALPFDDNRPALASPLLDELGLEQVAAHPVLRRVLGELTEGHLVELGRGVELDDLRLASGDSVRSVVAAALGDYDSDLIYRPLTPCRLVDTRVQGGAFAANTTRHYDLIGPTTYSTYGGSTSDCGIPGHFNFIGALSYNISRALVLNVVAVNPSGAGHLTAWPSNEARPAAAILNYSPGTTLANAVILETCDAVCTDLTLPTSCGDPCGTGDLSIHAAVSGTHLVIDVMGVMLGADDSSVAQDVVKREGPEIIGVDGDCHQILSCTLINASDKDAEALVMANAVFSDDDDEWAWVVITLAETVASCARYSTSGYGSAAYAASAIPFADVTLSAQRLFTVPARSTRTFYLNAQGSDTPGNIRNGFRSPYMHCLFLP